MVVGGTVVLKHDGARAGSRTLNLGIKRRLTVLDWTSLGMPQRDWRIRRSDAFPSQSVLARHRLPQLSCQISCQLRGPSAAPQYARSRCSMAESHELTGCANS
jgi:hypothetical protein